MIKRKGIILAGGSGTRLYPITRHVSKQLLPIYDKPMIYYPLTVLMMAGIREILIITTAQDQKQFKGVLGDGSQWGIELEYIIQPSPDGLAQSLILAESYLDGAPSALILGDNFFYGNGLQKVLSSTNLDPTGATVFGYHVSNPEEYGVLAFDTKGNVQDIIEKPNIPPSNYVVTGLYFFDNSATSLAKQVRPSKRGELEITSVLELYLQNNQLNVKKFGRGYTWLDTGSHSSLLETSNFVKTIIERQGVQIGCPEEIAFNQNWITNEQLLTEANRYKNNDYGKYLKNLL